MSARRLVALALTFITLLCTLVVPTLVLTATFPHTPHLSRDYDISRLLQGCSHSAPDDEHSVLGGLRAVLRNARLLPHCAPGRTLTAATAGATAGCRVTAWPLRLNALVPALALTAGESVGSRATPRWQASAAESKCRTMQPLVLRL